MEPVGRPARGRTTPSQFLRADRPDRPARQTSARLAVHPNGEFGVARLAAGRGRARRRSPALGIAAWGAGSRPLSPTGGNSRPGRRRPRPPRCATRLDASMAGGLGRGHVRRGDANRVRLSSEPSSPGASSFAGLAAVARPDGDATRPVPRSRRPRRARPRRVRAAAAGRCGGPGRPSCSRRAREAQPAPAAALCCLSEVGSCLLLRSTAWCYRTGVSAGSSTLGRERRRAASAVPCHGSHTVMGPGPSRLETGYAPSGRCSCCLEAAARADLARGVSTRWRRDPTQHPSDAWAAITLPGARLPEARSWLMRPRMSFWAPNCVRPMPSTRVLSSADRQSTPRS